MTARNSKRKRKGAKVSNELTALKERIMILEDKNRKLEQRIELYESKSGFMSAEEMLERCNAWIARNPKAWSLILSRADSSIIHRSRFSVKRVLEDLRDSNLVKMADEDWKISNNYAAVMARLLIKARPQLKEYGLLRVRPSKVDRLMQ